MKKLLQFFAILWLMNNVAQAYHIVATTTDSSATWGPNVKKIIRDSNRNLHLIYTADDDLGYKDIFYAYSTDHGLTWRAGLNLSNTAGATSEYPALEMDLNDTLYVTWTEGNTAQHLRCRKGVYENWSEHEIIINTQSPEGTMGVVVMSQDYVNNSGSVYLLSPSFCWIFQNRLHPPYFSIRNWNWYPQVVNPQLELLTYMYAFSTPADIHGPGWAESFMLIQILNGQQHDIFGFASTPHVSDVYPAYDDTSAHEMFPSYSYPNNVNGWPLDRGIVFIGQPISGTIVDREVFFGIPQQEGWKLNISNTPGIPSDCATIACLTDKKYRIVWQEGGEIVSVIFDASEGKIDPLVNISQTPGMASYSPAQIHDPYGGIVWTEAVGNRYFIVYDGPDSTRLAVEDTDADQALSDQWLARNYPNPFTDATTVAFTLPNSQPMSLQAVTLRIYNSAGQLVRSLLSEPCDSDVHTVSWNGINDAGKPLSSGVYLYRLQAGQKIATGKMMLIR